MKNKPKLLLFEDEIRNAKLIRRVCEKNFDITWVRNEAELDEEISEEFDVIVSDIRIKGTDDVRGHKIIEDIRRKYKLSRIPVIIYSGVVNVHEIEKERGRLFFSYVDKGDIDFATQLADKALEASAQKANISSRRYFKSRLEELGKLDETLDESDVSDALSILQTDPTQFKTVRDVIDQMNQSWLVEQTDVLEMLEDFAWDLIKKFEKEELDSQME